MRDATKPQVETLQCSVGALGRAPSRPHRNFIRALHNRLFPSLFHCHPKLILDILEQLCYYVLIPKRGNLANGVYLMPEDEQKRRGAPLGNHNAVKHGFYTKSLRSEDQPDIETALITDISPEIALIRLQIRRLVELSAESDNFDSTMQMVRVLSFASSALIRLLNTQKIFAQASFDEQMRTRLLNAQEILRRPKVIDEDNPHNLPDQFG